MGRWLLNTFPTVLLVLAAGLLPPLLVLLGARMLTRLRPAVADGAYGEVSGKLLTQVMAVFGFLLAFVIVNQYGDAATARADVQAEAYNLEDLYRVSLGFEEPARAQMVQLLRAYDERVIEQEWEALAVGRADPVAAKSLASMYTLMREYEPQKASAASLHGQAAGYLHEVHAARHRRLDAAASSLPGIFAGFLMVGAASAVGISMLQGLRGHALMLPLGLASMLGLTLFISLSLEHPFSGPGAIGSHHFKEGTLAQLLQERGQGGP